MTLCVKMISFRRPTLGVRIISWSGRFQGGRSSSTSRPDPDLQSNLTSAPVGLSGFGIPSGVNGWASDTNTYLYFDNLGKIAAISGFDRCWNT